MPPARAALASEPREPREPQELRFVGHPGREPQVEEAAGERLPQVRQGPESEQVAQ